MCLTIQPFIDSRYPYTYLCTMTSQIVHYSPSPNFKLTTLRLWGNYDENLWWNLWDNSRGNYLQNSQRSRNVLGARESSLMLRDTTDYRLKFVASPTTCWLLSYARKGPRKGGFPLSFANTWMRAHMGMRLSTQRAGLLNGYSIEFLVPLSSEGALTGTRWIISLSLLTKSQFQTQQSARRWGNYDENLWWNDDVIL